MLLSKRSNPTIEQQVVQKKKKASFFFFKKQVDRIDKKKASIFKLFFFP